MASPRRKRICVYFTPARFSSKTRPRQRSIIRRANRRQPEPHFRLGFGTGGAAAWTGATMGLGMVLGPGLGGWLGEISLSLPFYVAAGLSMLSMLLIWILLPESLHPARRTAIASSISLKAGEQQGALLGISASFQSLGRVAGPMWAGMLIDINVISPYLSSGIIMLLIYFASLILIKSEPRLEEPVQVPAGIEVL